MSTLTSISIKPISIACLLVISFISIILKLYLIDFSFPVSSDALGYLLMSISYTNDDYSQISYRGSGWPLFVSMFYQFLDTNKLEIYSNLIRIVSLGISTLTIPLMFLVSRKFFNQKYSLVCASLFAFEPHLNRNAGLGLSEPIFIAVVLLSFLFILNKNSKLIIPSLLFSGLAWWIKLDGFFIFFIITIIYFVTYKGKTNLKRNYLVGLIIFLIVISPMLMQKQEQFGNPFYSYYGDVMFAGNYEKLLAENTKYNYPTASDYIQEFGIQSFIDNYILKGIYNIFNLLSKLSFPYLFILIPFGIIFSFRAFDQNSQYIKANWLFLILASGSMIITLSVVDERRYLFYLLPFLIFFSVIPVQRVTEYGLNTFSFSRKQKNIFLIIVISIALSLSVYFTTNLYQNPDPFLENERLQLSNFMVKNLDGKIQRDFSPNMQYITYHFITLSPKSFTEYSNSKGTDEFSESHKLERIFVSGNSISELVSNGEKYELRYIFAYESQNNFHPFLDALYADDNKYPFLTKIFDSKAHDFKKIQVKLFEIDYKKFHEYNKNIKVND